MSGNPAINRIKDVLMPDYYFNYYNDISKNTFDLFEKAAVAKMHDIDIAEPLRELLKTNGKELSALIFSKEIALGKYLPSNAKLEDRLDLAVRVGLAIVTEGVTIAPL